MEDLSISDWWTLVPFTTHRIPVGADLWTSNDIMGVVAAEDLRTAVVLQECGGSLAGKTVVDIGCLEGAFTAEFARLGAALSVGIEPRKESFDRCEIVRKLTGLSNLRFIQADLKDELPKWEGQFDVVFMAGLLYHVSDPYAALRLVYRACRETALIDTHIAYEDFPTHQCGEIVERTWAGDHYKGRLFVEYPSDVDPSMHEKMLWAAYSDSFAFWPLEDDLVRMFHDVGFQTVKKINPAEFSGHWRVDPTNRVIYVCHK